MSYCHIVLCGLPFKTIYCITVSNCRPKPKTPATVGAPPTSDDAEMGGGDMGGDGSDDTPDNSGIVAECTITPILQDDGQPVRELVDTTKPKKKCTKCARERDYMAAKVLTMLEKDDDEDEVSLALASIWKHIKKSLNDAQVDAILDELNEVVGCHVGQLEVVVLWGTKGSHQCRRPHKHRCLHNSSKPAIITLCHHHHCRDWTLHMIQ